MANQWCCRARAGELWLRHHRLIAQQQQLPTRWRLVAGEDQFAQESARRADVDVAAARAALSLGVVSTTSPRDGEMDFPADLDTPSVGMPAVAARSRRSGPELEQADWQFESRRIELIAERRGILSWIKVWAVCFRTRVLFCSESLSGSSRSCAG